MYTVIGYPRARTGRVMWLLEELGQAYDLIPALPQSDAIKAYNPAGKVPVLKDGDDMLLDSVAICTYLADKHGALTFKAGTIDRAGQDSFTQFVVDEIEGALWTAAKHSFARPEEQRVPAIKEVCKLEFAQAMATLERRLADKAFVMGDTFTVPDILLGHAAAWARMAKFELPGGAVGAYLERIQARPACVRARQRGEAAIKPTA